jgi:hypothetical protein
MVAHGLAIILPSTITLITLVKMSDSLTVVGLLSTDAAAQAHTVRQRR